jgi:DNA-binding CsgD family transcriptional regulator
MLTSISQVNNGYASEIGKSQVAFHKKYSFQANYESAVLPQVFPQTVIEDLIDGILIVTEEGKLTYANNCAQRILRQLNSTESLPTLIPKEIWHICHSLIESRHLFPNQYWLIESKIFVGSSIAFNVQARWLKVQGGERSCILLSIRDRYQDIKEMVNEESQKYGLTCREKEVWLLHRANYTYKQVAGELCITPNTVKKHMKNIYSKQKAMFITEEA